MTLLKLQNIKHALSYRLGDKELEYAFNEKDLGVVINSPKLQLLNVQSYFDNYKWRLYDQSWSILRLHGFSWRLFHSRLDLILSCLIIIKPSVQNHLRVEQFRSWSERWMKTRLNSKDYVVKRTVFPDFKYRQEKFTIRHITFSTRFLRRSIPLLLKNLPTNSISQFFCVS